MRNVKELTERFVKEEEELMNSCLRTMNFTSLTNMEDGEIKMLRDTFKILNTANELLIEYARIINDMDAKLDRIVSKVEKN